MTKNELLKIKFVLMMRGIINNGINHVFNSRNGQTYKWWGHSSFEDSIYGDGWNVTRDKKGNIFKFFGITEDEFLTHEHMIPEVPSYVGIVDPIVSGECLFGILEIDALDLFYDPDTFKYIVRNRTPDCVLLWYTEDEDEALKVFHQNSFKIFKQKLESTNQYYKR